MVRTRILLADDHPEHRALVVHALVPLDVDIRQVEDGAHMVAALAQDGPFDLVISDIVMPWINGLEVLRMVRACGIATPVLLLSALSLDEISARTGPVRGVRSLRKPCRFSDLRATVAEMLGMLPSAA